MLHLMESTQTQGLTIVSLVCDGKFSFSLSILNMNVDKKKTKKKTGYVPT